MACFRRINMKPKSNIVTAMRERLIWCVQKAATIKSGLF